MGAGAAAGLLAPVAPAAEVPAHHPHINEHGWSMRTSSVLRR